MKEFLNSLKSFSHPHPTTLLLLKPLSFFLNTAKYFLWKKASNKMKEFLNSLKKNSHPHPPTLLLLKPLSFFLNKCCQKLPKTRFSYQSSLSLCSRNVDLTRWASCFLLNLFYCTVQYMVSILYFCRVFSCFSSTAIFCEKARKSVCPFPFLLCSSTFRQIGSKFWN